MSNEKIEELTYKTNSKLLYNELIRLDENSLIALLPKEIITRHTPYYNSQATKVGATVELLIQGSGVYYGAEKIEPGGEILVEKCYMYSKGSPTEPAASSVISMILWLLQEDYIQGHDVYSAIERKNYLHFKIGRHYKFTNNESGGTLEGVVIYNSTENGGIMAHVSFIGRSFNQGAYFDNPYRNNENSDYKIEEIKNER